MRVTSLQGTEHTDMRRRVAKLQTMFLVRKGDHGSFFRRRAKTTGAVAVCCWLGVVQAEAVEPLTIDDLGFNSVTDNQLFDTRFNIQGKTGAQPDSKERRPSVNVWTSIELTPTVSETDEATYLTGGYHTDRLDLSSPSQGFRIKRVGADIETGKGTLTVGTDWTNFQDVLYRDSRLQSSVLDEDDRQTADQIRWTSPNGVSIALEDIDQERTVSTASEPSVQTSPNVVLSWQGGSGGRSGLYRVSALGRTVGVEGAYQDRMADRRKTSWGLNLEGGWRFGDFMAALTVTIGEGIDNLILGDLPDSWTTSENYVGRNESFSIRPSLQYRLTDGSNLHVAIERYSTDGFYQQNGIDTLDTIHVGYTWRPWSSTQFGVKVTGKDIDDITGTLEDSTQLNFDARKHF